MKGFGGMITFFIKGNLENARRFLESVKIFALAESLGGVESLVDHPAIMTHASIPAETRKSLGITDNLIIKKSNNAKVLLYCSLSQGGAKVRNLGS